MIIPPRQLACNTLLLLTGLAKIQLTLVANEMIVIGIRIVVRANGTFR